MGAEFSLDSDVQTQIASIIGSDQQQGHFTKQFSIDGETRDDMRDMGMKAYHTEMYERYQHTLSWAQRKYPQYNFSMFMQCDEGEPYGFCPYGDLSCNTRFEVIKRT
jgi:hypothetical protein